MILNYVFVWFAVGKHDDSDDLHDSHWTKPFAYLSPVLYFDLKSLLGYEFFISCMFIWPLVVSVRIAFEPCNNLYLAVFALPDPAICFCSKMLFLIMAIIFFYPFFLWSSLESYAMREIEGVSLFLLWISFCHLITLLRSCEVCVAGAWFFSPVFEYTLKWLGKTIVFILSYISSFAWNGLISVAR